MYTPIELCTDDFSLCLLPYSTSTWEDNQHTLPFLKVNEWICCNNHPLASIPCTYLSCTPTNVGFPLLTFPPAFLHPSLPITLVYTHFHGSEKRTVLRQRLSVYWPSVWIYDDKSIPITHEYEPSPLPPALLFFLTMESTGSLGLSNSCIATSYVCMLSCQCNCH